MTWLIVGCLGILLLWVWLWWSFSNKRVPSRGPRMTPEEIQAAKAYAARQDVLKAEAEARARAEALAELEKENQVIDPAELKRQAREERRRRWEAEQEEKQRAEEQRLAEEAAIIKEFPTWLVTLAERRNFEKNVYTLKLLFEWVKIVLEYADYQPGRRVSVRGQYREFCHSEDAPMGGVTSHKFFVDLLKVLEESGKLEPDPTQTNARKLVENWE